MKKSFFAQSLFDLFDVSTENHRKYHASEMRKNNKVTIFDDLGNVVRKGSAKHREMYPEDFD
jgi:hypothetical protein